VANGAAISTNTLTGSTAGQANSNELFIEPAPGEPNWAVIRIENCNNNVPATGSYELDGSLIADTSGATVTTTHPGVTAEGTLTFAGNPAGLEGALTFTWKAATLSTSHRLNRGEILMTAGRVAARPGGFQSRIEHIDPNFLTF
jgi:hypothetical protein